MLQMEKDDCPSLSMQKVSDNICCPDKKAVLLINSKLRCLNVNERAKALRELRKLTTSSQCSTDLLTEYAVSWMLQCCKWNPSTANDELRILRVLVAYSARSADSKKVIMSTVLPQFVSQLMSMYKNTTESTIKLKLECLKTFLDFYGSSCSAYRNDFSKFVFHCLERYASSKGIIKEAAVCFVRLCSCHNKLHSEISAKPANVEEMWSSQFKKLIATCHKLFDLVYVCIDANADALATSENVTDNVINSLIELESTHENNSASRFRGWIMKFFVISELLKAMLTCRYLACKYFNPSELLRLIRRLVASVTPITLEKCTLTNDVIELRGNLPHIHAYAFDVLRSLIICAQRNLISYGSFICSLCAHTIKWSSKCLSTGSTEYVRLRCKVYSVLSTWIWIAKSGSSIEVFADDVITAIIADVDFVKPSVQLNKNSKTHAKKRHANGKVASNANLQIAYSGILPNEHLRERVCLSAHRLLRALLNNASTMLRLDHYQRLQRTVIQLALRSSNGVSESIGNTSIHLSSECKLQSLKSLLTLVVESHYSSSSVVSLAIKILELASNDRQVEISAFCARALSVLEIMTHPRGGTLTRFVDAEGRRDALPIPIISNSENYTTDVDALPLNNIINSCRNDGECRNDAIGNELTITPSDSPSTHTSRNRSRMKKIKLLECVQPCLRTEKSSGASAAASDNKESVSDGRAPFLSAVSVHQASDNTINATISLPTNEKYDKQVVETAQSIIEKDVATEVTSTDCKSDITVQSLLNDFVDTL